MIVLVSADPLRDPLSDIVSSESVFTFKDLKFFSRSAVGDGDLSDFASDGILVEVGVFGDDVRRLEVGLVWGPELEDRELRVLDTEARRFKAGFSSDFDTWLVVMFAATMLGLLTGGFPCSPSVANFRMLPGGVVRKPSIRFMGVSPDRRVVLL